MSEDLKIKSKVEDCLAWSYVALRQFPKHERHVLAAEIRTSLWQLLRLVVTCNRRHFKKTTLQDLDVELDLLRSQVRLAHTLRYIDIAKYEIWARQLDGNSADANPLLSNPVGNDWTFTGSSPADDAGRNAGSRSHIAEPAWATLVAGWDQHFLMIDGHEPPP